MSLTHYCFCRGLCCLQHLCEHSDKIIWYPTINFHKPTGNTAQTLNNNTTSIEHCFCTELKIAEILNYKQDNSGQMNTQYLVKINMNLIIAVIFNTKARKSIISSLLQIKYFILSQIISSSCESCKHIVHLILSFINIPLHKNH